MGYENVMSLRRQVNLIMWLLGDILNFNRTSLLLIIMDK